MSVYWPDDLTVGKRYRVSIEDCCVTGCFIATLTSKEAHVVAFDNGIVLEIDGAATRFEEVGDE